MANVLIAKNYVPMWYFPIVNYVVKKLQTNHLRQVFQSHVDIFSFGIYAKAKPQTTIRIGV